MPRFEWPDEWNDLRHIAEWTFHSVHEIHVTPGLDDCVVARCCVSATSHLGVYRTMRDSQSCQVPHVPPAACADANELAASRQRRVCNQEGIGSGCRSSRSPPPSNLPRLSVVPACAIMTQRVNSGTLNHGFPMRRLLMRWFEGMLAIADRLWLFTEPPMAGP